MKLAILSLIATAMFAQNTGTPVRISDEPGPVGVQMVLGYSGSNLAYVCMSPSNQPSRYRGPNGVASSLSAATSTQANPTVIAVTHQFAIGTRPTITISGVTGVGYVGVGINTSFVATVVDSTHISIPFDSSALGAATWTVGTFTTTAPRLNQPEWAVKTLAYDGSSNLINVAWFGIYNATPPASGGSTGYVARCSDAAGTTVGTQ